MKKGLLCVGAYDCSSTEGVVFLAKLNFEPYTLNRELQTLHRPL